MSVKQNNRKASRRNAQRVVYVEAPPSHPPPFLAAVVVKKTLRFKANAAVSNVNITAANLLDLLCLADTTTSAYRLMSSARLDSVELWGPMASDLAPVTVAVEFQTTSATSIGAPNALKSDTSMGAQQCAHVAMRPPAQSLAAMWQSLAATGTLFTLNGPINMVVDIHLSLYLQNGESPTAVTSAVAGATVGTVYCRGLDALAAASTKLPPVSYATI